VSAHESAGAPADAVAFARIDPAGGERFQTLRRELGVSGFGLNAIVLAPGERGRVHSHEHQEEVYLVLEGELTLVLEDAERVLGRYELARVAPSARRQLVNAGREPVVLVALGGSGEHQGRDGRAWSSWEEQGDGRSPQEVPLPADLPPRS
jgi:mannose-6-phosphate isomerase-like protein (cupin superfamily)